MMYFDIKNRNPCILVACVAAFLLLACEDPPRFAQDDCAKSPTPECLLYFAHQAALEIDGPEWWMDSERSLRLFMIAPKQFRIGDETGALVTVADIEESEVRSYLYTSFAVARARSGNLESAVSYLERAGDPDRLNRKSLRQYAQVQALKGDLEGALTSLEKALQKDKIWRSDLLQRAERYQEKADSEEFRLTIGVRSLYNWLSDHKRAKVERLEQEAHLDNDPVLSEIALDLARHGRQQDALSFVSRIVRPSTRAHAYLTLAEEFAKAGTRTNSEIALRKAFDAAELTKPGYWRVRRLARIAEAMLRQDLAGSAQDALDTANRDASTTIGDRKERFQAALEIAGVEGRLGRVEDAWNTIEMALAAHAPSYIDVFSDTLRLSLSERYREASLRFSRYIRDPGKKSEILVDIANTARRMGEHQAAKSLLGLASREAEHLPPQRADERRSLLTAILRQHSCLNDEFGIKQTVSRIYSSLSQFESTEKRDEAIRRYARSLLYVDEHEAARRLLRELHHRDYEETFSLFLSAGDLGALEEASSHLEAPDLRFKALYEIHRAKARARAEAGYPVDEFPSPFLISAVVQDALDIAAPEDRSQRLEYMADYLIELEPN